MHDDHDSLQSYGAMEAGGGAHDAATRRDSRAGAAGAFPPDVDPMEYGPHPHSFIMVGHEALFLCHMTSLWMSGHTYEAVVRAHVPYDVMREYLRVTSTPDLQRAETHHAPTTCFVTNELELFPLPELPLGRRTFVGRLFLGMPKQYAGWPWTGETPIVDRFPVEVERVVDFRHYDYGVERPAAQTYTLFGEGAEAHLYHRQAREPDYDHIATLQHAPAWLHPQRLRLGVRVEVPDLCGCVTPPADPFVAKRTWNVRYHGTGPPRELTVAHSSWFATFVTNRPVTAATAHGLHAASTY